MGKPKIDVLILSWNEAGYTEGCLESFEKIDYKNFEIFLLDNGSREEESEKLKKIVKKSKNKVRLFSAKENLGFTGGNNFLIKEALKDKKAEYFLLINNDTLLEKDFLSLQVEFLEENEKAGVVGPLIYHDKDKINWENSPGVFNMVIGGARMVPHWREIIKTREDPIKVDYLSGCSLLVRRKIFEEDNSLLKEKYFIFNEEIEWAYRLSKRGYQFYLFPKSRIYHIGHATVQKISGFKLYYNVRNIIWFERQYAKKSQLLLFSIFLFLYKIPRMILRIMLEKDDTFKKIRKYLSGVKEGYLKSYQD